MLAACLPDLDGITYFWGPQAFLTILNEIKRSGVTQDELKSPNTRKIRINHKSVLKF
jgi:hypothetical protein